MWLKFLFEKYSRSRHLGSVLTVVCVAQTHNVLLAHKATNSFVETNIYEQLRKSKF